MSDRLKDETPPATLDRRNFFHQATLATSSVAAVAALAPSLAQAADEPLVMGAIGCGGQGTGLIQSFASQDDIRLAFVCDPDQARANQAADKVASAGKPRPQVVSDLRRVLSDPSVAAVTVATPDHWHGPATLLALAAGKHVYVEKPCAHNIREGRLMVEAARKHDRVVQVGTQSRSTEHVRRAMELLREGAIGDVVVAKAWNSQLRGNIGHAQPGDPPADFDYDLWVGPAPMVPFQSNRQHYNWHWWYDFGTGDMGNDGVHDIDIARWGLGVEQHPTTVAAAGGKYVFDDDQQFPDTQYVVFEYPVADSPTRRKQLVYEHRIWSPYVQEGYENGNAFYGTKGCLILGKSAGWKLFGPKNELRDSMQATKIGLPHHRNFIDSIRSHQRPHADIEIGHLSAALCHLGNLACRFGRRLNFDPATEQIVGDPEVAACIRRQYRDGHWAVPQNV
jgi:predicted dehydrogenase